MSRRLAWQSREDDVIARAAATAKKKELGISQGWQTVQCDLECRLGGRMHGTCGWWGTWEPTHTGMPLGGRDGILGGGTISRFKFPDSCYPPCKVPLAGPRFLMLGTGSTGITGPPKCKFKARAGRRRRA